MRKTWSMTLQSFLLSIFLHIIIGGLLVFSFEFAPEPPPAPKSAGNIIKAVSVDKKQVQDEIQRLKDIEKEKINKEIARQKQLEKKADEFKRKRIGEEKRLAKLEKEKQQQQLKRQQEEQLLKKLQEEKEEIEKERQVEENKKQRVEQERKRLEEEKKKEEAELKRLAEEKRKAEEERKKEEAKLKRLAEEKRKAEEEKKKKEAEERRKAEQERVLQEAIAVEQAILDAEQSQHEQTELSRYSGLIINAITNKFNQLGLERGLSCVLSIRMSPEGDVVEAVIVKSSRNGLFDRRAVSAVYAASPLPVPDDRRLFEKMRDLVVTFDPEDQG